MQLPLARRIRSGSSGQVYGLPASLLSLSQIWRWAQPARDRSARSNEMATIEIIIAPAPRSDRPHLTFVQGREFNFPTQHTPKAIGGPIGIKRYPMRYAIRCTPGGLLKDDATGNVIDFATYAEAETEAVRLTRQAHSNPRFAGVDFAPVEVPEREPSSP